MLKNELTINIIFDFCLEKVRKIMKSFIMKGLIDDTFSYDYTQEQGFGFAMVGGDTNEPDKLSGCN